MLCHRDPLARRTKKIRVKVGLSRMGLLTLPYIRRETSACSIGGSICRERWSPLNSEAWSMVPIMGCRLASA